MKQNLSTPDSGMPDPSGPCISAESGDAIKTLGATASVLYEAIRPWRGKSAYVVPIADKSGKLFGNNGDELLMKVFFHILDQAGIQVTDAIHAADVLFVPPNGALLEMYAFPGLLKKYTAGNVVVPMIIFPSSAHFPTKNPAFIFSERQTKTIWILREKYSYDHLLQTWGDKLSAAGCELLLDHDVVASHGEFVRQLFGPVKSGRPLVGARKDVERDAGSGPARRASFSSDAKSSGLMRRSVVSAFIERFPYGWFYTRLVRLVRAKAQRSAGFDLINRLPAEERPKFSVRGTTHRDASSKHQATFKQYRRAIATSGPVLTDRLHIALPAAILGKEVFLVEGGYHKARGVIERSLADSRNMHLIVPDPVGGR